MTTLLLSLAMSAAAQPPARPDLSGARRWACYYGAALSTSAWRGLDLLVLDPDNYRNAAVPGPLRVAYVSAGEADERRASWKRVRGKPYLVEPNPDWQGDHRVDVRDPEWQAEVRLAVSSALAAGFDGVMLDTLDVAEYLESSAPARYGGAVAAAADLVLSLRAAHPEAVLLMNNGLALLSRVGPALDGVMIEDLYTRCMPGTEPCGPSPEAESAAKEARLARFRRETGRPVFVFLYSRLDERRLPWVREAAERSRRMGFFPYLAAPTLDRLGLVDPHARR